MNQVKVLLFVKHHLL
jgi:hypothetical protein